MTRVDFYILEDNARDDRFGLACRLAEKAWQQGHRVLIQADSEEEARHLDRLLWVYRDQNFVPHGMLGKADNGLNPILIALPGQEPGEEHGVLINLATEVPRFFSRFERVAECVDKDEGARQRSRERFRFYREHGYPLESHQIG